MGYSIHEMMTNASKDLRYCNCRDRIGRLGRVRILRQSPCVCAGGRSTGRRRRARRHGRDGPHGGHGGHVRDGRQAGSEAGRGWSAGRFRHRCRGDQGRTHRDHRRRDCGGHAACQRVGGAASRRSPGASTRINFKEGGGGGQGRAAGRAGCLDPGRRFAAGQGQSGAGAGQLQAHRGSVREEVRQRAARRTRRPPISRCRRRPWPRPRRSFNKTRIVAPFAGVVGIRNVSRRRLRQGGSGPGQPGGHRHPEGRFQAAGTLPRPRAEGTGASSSAPTRCRASPSRRRSMRSIR